MSGNHGNYYEPEPDIEEDSPWVTPHILDLSKVPRRFLRRHWSQNGETWTTRDGRVIPIRQLTPSHLNNLMRYLVRNVKGAKDQYELWVIDQDSGPLGPSGDMAMDASDQSFDALLEKSNLEWLSETPLWRALDAEKKRRAKKKGAKK